jgi:hypothetical protein
MELKDAIAIVAADQRQGYPDMTDAEAVAHVRNTVTFSDPAPVGAYPLDDDGSDEATAYRMVLSATDADLDAAL